MTTGLGEVAFRAYSAKVGGFTYDDKPIPHWDELTDEVRAGWEAAADAAVNGWQERIPA